MPWLKHTAWKRACTNPSWSWLKRMWKRNFCFVTEGEALLSETQKDSSLTLPCDSSLWLFPVLAFVTNDEKVSLGVEIRCDAKYWKMLKVHQPKCKEPSGSGSLFGAASDEATVGVSMKILYKNMQIHVDVYMYIMYDRPLPVCWLSLVKLCQALFSFIELCWAKASMQSSSYVHDLTVIQWPEKSGTE